MISRLSAETLPVAVEVMAASGANYVVKKGGFNESVCMDVLVTNSSLKLGQLVKLDAVNTVWQICAVDQGRLPGCWTFRN